MTQTPSPFSAHRLYLIGLLFILLCTPLLAGQIPYRFTYDNPSIGDRQAPFVLEYFSLVDCSPCREFEISALPKFRSLVDAGHLRVVFRDLPPSEPSFDAASRLFCLQEYPDYLDRRLALKRTAVDESPDLPVLRGKTLARHRACLMDDAASPILTHNRSDFAALGFHGTPGFLLSFFDTSAVHTFRWNKPITYADLISAVAELSGVPFELSETSAAAFSALLD